VKDEGSRFGTFVNDRRVTEQGLSHGDVVEFGLGGPTLRFESDEQAPGDDEEPITLEEVVPVPDPDYGQEGYSSFTAIRPALPDLDPPAGRVEGSEAGETPPRQDGETTVEREVPARPGDETTVEREIVPRPGDGTTVELQSPGARSGGRRVAYVVGGLVLVAAAVLWVRACAAPLAGDVPDPSSSSDDPGAPVAPRAHGATTSASLPRPS
jgi:hypothetical protein